MSKLELAETVLMSLLVSLCILLGVAHWPVYYHRASAVQIEVSETDIKLAKQIGDTRLELAKVRTELAEVRAEMELQKKWDKYQESLLHAERANLK